MFAVYCCSFYITVWCNDMQDKTLIHLHVIKRNFKFIETTQNVNTGYNKLVCSLKTIRKYLLISSLMARVKQILLWWMPNDIPRNIVECVCKIKAYSAGISSHGFNPRCEPWQLLHRFMMIPGTWNDRIWDTSCKCLSHSPDCRFAPSQWETPLLCNGVSHGGAQACNQHNLSKNFSCE